MLTFLRIFLQILFLRATLSTKTFMNTGPGFWVSGNSRASQSLSFMWSISSWVLQIGWRSDACDGSDGGVRFRDWFQGVSVVFGVCCCELSGRDDSVRLCVRWWSSTAIHMNTRIHVMESRSYISGVWLINKWLSNGFTLMNPTRRLTTVWISLMTRVWTVKSD